MDWSRRRHRYNHDWLKNQFIAALLHLMAIAQGSVTDPEFVALFFESIFPQWQLKRQVALRLAATFEAEMSPLVFFEEKYSASITRVDDAWIANVIEALWRARTQPEQYVSATLQAIAGCDVACSSTATIAMTSTQTLNISRLGDLIEAFSELAEALSSFPSRVTIL